MSGATEAWQPLQLAEVFGQEPPSMARSFYADIFEIEAQAERELQLTAKNERILEWRRALENGAQEIEISSSDVWQCLVGQAQKRQVGSDGGDASRFARGANFVLCEKHARYVLLAQLPGDMVSGHGVSHSRKPHPRASPGRPYRQLSYRTDRALKQCT